MAMTRRRAVVGEGYERGNWQDLILLVDEMDKENPAPLNCDFDLVLKEAQLTQPQLSQQPARGGVRRAPGVVTVMQEERLPSAVAAERAATGAAIDIKDRWRCHEERCSNNPWTCWVRRPPGRQIDRFEDHYPVSGNIIAAWALAVERRECTIEEPSDDVRLSIMIAKDRSEAEKRRKRRKVSPTSSNSSIEGLTKAILAGHLAQMSAQRCQHHPPASDLPGEYSKRWKVWEEFECPQPELQQHTFNFFRYWLRAMPQFEVHIKEIKQKVFIDGSYDINMLMDPVTGMTLEAWVEYFNQAPGMLSHLKRKAKD